MSHPSRGLAGELPECKGLIHDLRMADAHFARLLERYEQVSHDIENSENGVAPQGEDAEHKLKSLRVHLKDDLMRIIEAHRKDNGCCGQCGHAAHGHH